MAGGPDQAGGGKDREHPGRLGAYRVESLIGAGGMGVVYRAFDEALERPVALKTLLPALAADAEFVARFKREAQSAAALNHPNITQIYAIGQEGTVPFFAMEMIHGRSLEAIAKERGAIEAMEAAGYILQAAYGLRHAAQKKLIHRDVKPSNLMLADDGVVKITDFGLAKAARSETQLTATGEILGSPGYISPEQAQGGALDVRSDIYSLGATFYHLVTGKLPFEAATPVAMIIKHMNEPLRSPRVVNPAIPYPIAAAIQKMMAKRPNERFQDYDALIRELERSLAVGRPAAGQAAAAAGAAPAGPAAAGAAAWSGMTGMEGRGGRLRGADPRRAAAPAEVAADRHAGSWLPVLLVIGLAALIIGWLYLRGRSEPVAGGEAQAALAGTGSSGPGGSGVEAEGSFTTRPAAGGGQAAGPAGGMTVAERLRDRIANRGRPNLTFVTTDHEFMSDGRMRVFGRVQNHGSAVAARVRVRIRVLRENGEVSAEAETPLVPPILPAGAVGSFEVPIDYSGSFGTINAEVHWLE
jgi:predicted Ser/Thr protein kinase